MTGGSTFLRRELGFGVLPADFDDGPLETQTSWSSTCASSEIRALIALVIGGRLWGPTPRAPRAAGRPPSPDRGPRPAPDSASRSRLALEPGERSSSFVAHGGRISRRSGLGPRGRSQSPSRPESERLVRPYEPDELRVLPAPSDPARDSGRVPRPNEPPAPRDAPRVVPDPLPSLRTGRPVPRPPCDDLAGPELLPERDRPPDAPLPPELRPRPVEPPPSL